MNINQIHCASKCCFVSPLPSPCGREGLLGNVPMLFCPPPPPGGKGGVCCFVPPPLVGPLGVAQINKSSKRMHKTSQVRTLNKYIGGQIHSKLTLVFFCCFRSSLGWVLCERACGLERCRNEFNKPPPPPGANIGRASDIFVCYFACSADSQC